MGHKGGYTTLTHQISLNRYPSYLTHLNNNNNDKKYCSLIRYGCAQTYKLPESGFGFISKTEIEKIDWAKIDLTQDIGYFVECDLAYPQDIQEETNDFPLCPQNIIITYDMLSTFQKKSLNKNYNKTSYNQRKLTATFLNRNKM